MNRNAPSIMDEWGTMESKLGLLEAKVVEAVGRIKDLRTENESLKRQCAELKASLAEAEGTAERLHNELEQKSQEASLVGDYEEKRKEIEDKVGGLLAKLEALG